MALDIITGFIVLWSLVRGWSRGFLYQLGSIGMLAIAFVVARTVADPLEAWLAGQLNLSPIANQMLAFAAVFFVVYLVGSLILRSFIRDVRDASATISAGDRILGTLAGVVKGMLFAYLLILALIMINRTTGRLPIPYGSSVAGRWVMQHNFLESEEFPRARALVKLGWLLTSRDKSELAKDPHVHAILEHPKSAVLREPNVADALARGDWVEVMSHDGIWDLLDEPEVQEHLNAIAWEDRHDRPEAPAPPEETPPDG
ncbi:MAG: CvpA family protein [Myxococcota bacterium]